MTDKGEGLRVLAQRRYHTKMCVGSLGVVVRGISCVVGMNSRVHERWVYRLFPWMTQMPASK